MAGIVNKTSDLSPADQIRRGNTTALNMLRTTYVRNWALFWENPNATPQQVADDFGTSAAALFAASQATAALLASIDASLVPADMQGVPPTYTVTFNADGTVAIVAVPQPPAAADPTPLAPAQ